MDKLMKLEHDRARGTVTFDSFSRRLKSAIKYMLPVGCNLEKYYKGYFFINGFISRSDGRIIYFHIRNYRWWDKYTSVMYRFVDSLDDHTGYTNHFTDIPNLVKSMVNAKFTKERKGCFKW